MKKILAAFLLVVFAFGCDSGHINNNNPNIPNYTVNLEINMTLPGYSNLQFASNYVIFPDYGARGIIVFNAGSSYVAFDLACPNQPYNTCTSPMSVSGIQATCGCDNTVYNLFSGQASGQQYPMKQYRVDLNGSYLYVSN